MLHIPLVKVLKDNLYPAPTTILRAIKAIKIPSIEGQEKIYHWSDVFTLHWMRSYVHRNVAFLKLEILDLMDKSSGFRWFVQVFCCGLFCLGQEEGDVDKLKKECAKCGTWTWNCCCLCWCCCACCGLCYIKDDKEKRSSVPLKPVVLRRDFELEILQDIEKKRHKYKPKQVEYQDEQEAWMHSHGHDRKKSKWCVVQ